MTSSIRRSCLSLMVISCLLLEIHARGDGALRGGVDDQPVIALVEVGVALGKLGQRLAEDVAGAEIAGDRDAITGSRVGPGEAPRALLPVELQPLGQQRVDLEGPLPVA